MTNTENEIIEEQSALLKRLGLSDFESIIVDGKIVNDVNNIEKLLNTAHSVHYNYKENELIISSTEEASKKYFATLLPDLNTRLETARQSALNQDITEALPVDWSNLQEKIENEMEVNSINRSLSDPHLHDFYVADYSDHSFYALDIGTGMIISPVVNNLDMSTPVQVHYAFNTGVNIPLNYSYPISPYISAAIANNESHLRNASDDQSLLVFFFSGANYGAPYTVLELGPNSDVELLDLQVRPNGTDFAQSVWHLKY